MDVIIWSTQKVPDVKNGKELVAAIKANGTEIEHIGLQDILINGQFFILGGRKSITKALSKSPGAFRCSGGTIAGRLARLSTGTFSKTYTIIKLSNQTAGAFDARGWANMHLRGKFDTPIGNRFGPRGTTRWEVGGAAPASIVPFSDVIDGMWKADAETVAKLAGI